MSQMIAELEARGILQVSEHPQDRRARVVEFSSFAQSLRQASSEILVELEEALKSRLGARRFEAMRAALMADWGEPPNADGMSTRPRPPRNGASRA
jgi:DNA-binding MarR family transcriptional regulator